MAVWMPFLKGAFSVSSEPFCAVIAAAIEIARATALAFVGVVTVCGETARFLFRAADSEWSSLMRHTGGKTVPVRSS